ncbi:MAG: BamA/TamA family outer membrane protein [Planctomycetota bacterium]|nr:BamA/TamA family outer membrane protein [Planctomycetota bacterium]
MIFSTCVLALPMASFGSLIPIFPTQEQARVIEIVEVLILGAGDKEEAIRAALRMRPGVELTPEILRRDQEFLWKRMRVRLLKVEKERLVEGGLRLHLTVETTSAMRRVLFEGNLEMDRDLLLVAAGISSAQSVDIARIPSLAEDLAAYYRGEGYLHVSVQPQVYEEAGQLVFLIDEGPLVKVGSIEFVGNEAFPARSFLGVGESLTSNMEGGTGTFITPGSTFTEGMFERDIVAIEELYRDYGYLDVEVSTGEVSFSEDLSRAHIQIGVNEGAQYRVRSLSFQNDLGGPLEYSDEELLGVVGLRPGQVYEKARVKADESALRRFYGIKGHPSSRRSVGRSDVFFSFSPPNGEPLQYPDPETAEVDVTYLIREGQKMRIRDVLVAGNTRTKDRVIRRMISLEPGDLADGSEAVRSWRRVLGTNWFQDPETRQPFVDWRFIEADRPGWVDLRYEVAEGQTGRALFGGGFNSNTGAFLSVQFQKENFDIAKTPTSWGTAVQEILNGDAFTGAGQTLRAFVAPGREFSTYSLDFTEPDLFLDHIDRVSLNIKGFETFHYLRTHQERRTAGSFRLGRHFGRHFSIWAGPEMGRVNLSNPDPGAPTLIEDIVGTHILNSVSAGLSYNSIDNPFSPVDGFKVRLSHKFAGGSLGGDWEFQSTDARVEKYFPLGYDRLDRPFIAALIGRVRFANETGDLGVLPYTERFFLGGQGTLRGFDFRGAGPRESGFPLGGEAAWNASLEVRAPLLSSRVRDSVDEVEYARGALWVDAGALGDGLNDFDSTRIAAGVGVRIRLPMMPQMPLSLDFGWPIKSESFDDTSVFTFSLGNF